MQFFRVNFGSQHPSFLNIFHIDCPMANANPATVSDKAAISESFILSGQAGKAKQLKTATILYLMSHKVLNILGACLSIRTAQAEETEENDTQWNSEKLVVFHDLLAYIPEIIQVQRRGVRIRHQANIFLTVPQYLVPIERKRFRRRKQGLGGISNVHHIQNGNIHRISPFNVQAQLSLNVLCPMSIFPHIRSGEFGHLIPDSILTVITISILPPEPFRRISAS